MVLNIAERLILLSILPQQGDFITLRIIRDLQSILSFTEEELKDFKLEKLNDGFKWDKEAEKEKEIAVGEKVFEIIKETLVKLNDEKKLTMQHFSLCEKFKVGE